MRFTVQVLDDDGDAVVGKRVHVSFTGLLRGWLEEFTDDDGQAVFDYENVEPGEAAIFVNDEKFGPYDISDGDGLTVNI